MKKKTVLFLATTLFLLHTMPIIAQNAYGQDETEDSKGNAGVQTATASSESSDQAMIQIQQEEQVQINNDEDTIGIEEQNQNEIKKVIINKGEDSQLQVQTENSEEEKQEYQTEDGEQLLFQMESNNEGEDSQLKIRKNADGDTFIEENGTELKANFSMEVDTETGLVTITTGSGKTVELTEDSSQLLESLKEEYNLDQIDEYELVEEVADELSYYIKGTNTRKFLGLFNVDVPIEANINCENTDEIEVKEPWYINIFGFLFSE